MFTNFVSTPFSKPYIYYNSCLMDYVNLLLFYFFLFFFFINNSNCKCFKILWYYVFMIVYIHIVLSIDKLLGLFGNLHYKRNSF